MRVHGSNNWGQKLQHWIHWITYLRYPNPGPQEIQLHNSHCILKYKVAESRKLSVKLCVFASQTPINCAKLRVKPSRILCHLLGHKYDHFVSESRGELDCGLSSTLEIDQCLWLARKGDLSLLQFQGVNSGNASLLLCTITQHRSIKRRNLSFSHLLKDKRHDVACSTIAKNSFQTPPTRVKKHRTSSLIGITFPRIS